MRCWAIWRKTAARRWQRDLTDSTVLRNMGVAFGYTQLGFTALLRGPEQAGSQPRRWPPTWTPPGNRWPSRFRR